MKGIPFVLQTFFQNTLYSVWLYVNKKKVYVKKIKFAFYSQLKMENEDNSRLDGIDNVQNGLSQQHKMQLSSKATAFSIAAIIGSENNSNDMRHAQTSNEDQHSSDISPLGKTCNVVLQCVIWANK